MSAVIDTLEPLDGLANLRNCLRDVSTEKGEWSGIPMPLDGENLVIEPSYPYAEALSGKCDDADESPFKDYKVRNMFWSSHFRSDVVMVEKDGRVQYGLIPGVHGLDKQLRTLGCSEAWGVEQEHKALMTLSGMLRHQQFKKYLLTGSFIESSKRSGVVYMFRKLRPTVAITLRKGEPKILCALCMHPIAYYQDSWAGAMCPTDDVIAHLMMMRGDEPMLWRRSNQHVAHRPEAGL